MSERLITCPYYIYKGRRRHTITLSKYRNWHYRTSDTLKKLYLEHMRDHLRHVRFDKIQLRLVLYKPTRTMTDMDNALSIHAKFLLDAMVRCGCLVDDNHDYVRSISLEYGGLDRENPRVEAYVLDILDTII